jgi:hypothetical protein
MGEVSKLAKGDPPKRLEGRELEEIDSVKKVSILIDVNCEPRPVERILQKLFRSDTTGFL